MRDEAWKFNPESWRVALVPFPSPPCKCERPTYCRDELLGRYCLKCGRRPRIELEDFHIRQL